MTKLLLAIITLLSAAIGSFLISYLGGVFNLSQFAFIFIFGLIVSTISVFCAYSLLQSQLQQHITDISKISGTDSVNLSWRASEQGLLKPYTSQFNKILSQLDKHISNIRGSASRLIPMSQELVDVFSNVNQKTVLQAQYGQTMSDILQQIEQTNHLITQHTDAIESSDHDGVSSVEISQQVVADTVDSINQ
jgi:methyl-accepting chemotaxis protein